MWPSATHASRHALLAVVGTHASHRAFLAVVDFHTEGWHITYLDGPSFFRLLLLGILLQQENRLMGSMLMASKENKQAFNWVRGDQGK